MALANITLADGKATPVTRTFTYDAEGAVNVYSDKSNGIAIGEPKITITQSRPTRQRPSQKTVLKVEVPALEVVSGSDGGYTPRPKVAYTTLFECHFVSPSRSTIDDRKDLFAFATNLLAKSMVKSLVVDYSPVQ